MPNKRGEPCSVKLGIQAYQVLKGNNITFAEEFPLTMGLWHKSIDDLAARFPHAYRRGELPARYPVPAPKSYWFQVPETPIGKYWYNMTGPIHV
jgi:hypothetical protein